MKRLIAILLSVCIATNTYAAADIIWTKTKDITELGIEINDFEPDQDYTLKTYPVMVLKNGTYYCFATTERGDQRQLYGKQKVDLYQDGSTIEYRWFDKNTGKLLHDTVTEDGYWLDSSGRVIEIMGCARDYSTPGFKFLKTSKEFTYMDKEFRTPRSTWCAISPKKDNIYYWYYFDDSGKLITNTVKVQGKYEVNKEGQYMENKQVVCFYLADDEQLKLEDAPNFVDTMGLRQDALVIGPKDTVGIQGINNQTVYATQTKMQTFLMYVDASKAVNCDLDITDRNFWDQNSYEEDDDGYRRAGDNKGIIKNTIQMRGKDSSFSFNCKRYNYLKIKYCLDTTNGLQVPTYTGNDDITTVFQIFVDGEQVWYDDNLIKTQNPVTVAEIETEKQVSANSIILFSYSTNNSNFRVNITVDTMKKIKYDDSEEKNESNRKSNK